jgi:DNA-binding IscR family transcriptional regulator
MTVVKIVDGFEIFDRCGIGLKTCSDKNPCPIHFSYKEVKQRIKDLLSEKTLSELGEDVLKGKSIVSYR